MNGSINELRSMLDLAFAFAIGTESVEKHIADQGYNHDDGTRIGGPYTRTKRETWKALKSVSHFNLHQSLELILKFILRLEGTQYNKRHPLAELYDQLSPGSQGEVDRAYRRMMDAVGHGEQTGVGFYYGEGPPPPMPNVPVSSAKQGFQDLDKSMRLHMRRYAYEDVGSGDVTLYFLDLGGWIEFFNDISRYAHRLFREDSVRTSAPSAT